MLLKTSKIINGPLVKGVEGVGNMGNNNIHNNGISGLGLNGGGGLVRPYSSNETSRPSRQQQQQQLLGGGALPSKMSTSMNVSSSTTKF
jgi:hypothetical protein